MTTYKKRLGALAGVAAMAALLFTAVPASAGETDIEVSGTAVCGDAMGVPEYTLNWTVTNNEDGAVQITSAIESGAFTGTVTFTPNPIPANSAATGSDGPVPGDTVGQVVLTVSWSIVGGPSGTETGVINLTECVPPPTSSSSSSSTSSSTTSTIRPTTTVRAAVVTPAFTG